MLEVEETNDSILVTWSDLLIEFFESRRLFLRYPWQVTGAYKPGAKIRIGKKVVAESYSNHPTGRILAMGAFSYCRTANIAPDFQVGRYCSVARDVQLSEQEHPLNRISTHPFTTHQHMITFAREEFGREVRTTKHTMTGPAPRIGHDVWIGSGALIKRGITIGNGAVVGARALVTRDVPAFAVVGGAPARILKYRFAQEEQEALLESEWWRYNYADFPDIPPTDVMRFVSELGSMVEAGKIAPFAPRRIDVVAEMRAEFSF